MIGECPGTLTRPRENTSISVSDQELVLFADPLLRAPSLSMEGLGKATLGLVLAILIILIVVLILVALIVYYVFEVLYIVEDVAEDVGQGVQTIRSDVARLRESMFRDHTPRDLAGEEGTMESKSPSKKTSKRVGLPGTTVTIPTTSNFQTQGDDQNAPIDCDINTFGSVSNGAFTSTTPPRMRPPKKTLLQKIFKTAPRASGQNTWKSKTQGQERFTSRPATSGASQHRPTPKKVSFSPSTDPKSSGETEPETQRFEASNSPVTTWATSSSATPVAFEEKDVQVMDAAVANRMIYMLDERGQVSMRHLKNNTPANCRVNSGPLRFQSLDNVNGSILGLTTSGELHMLKPCCKPGTCQCTTEASWSKVKILVDESPFPQELGPVEHVSATENQPLFWLQNANFGQVMSLDPEKGMLRPVQNRVPKDSEDTRFVVSDSEVAMVKNGVVFLKGQTFEGRNVCFHRGEFVEASPQEKVVMESIISFPCRSRELCQFLEKMET